MYGDIGSIGLTGPRGKLGQYVDLPADQEVIRLFNQGKCLCVGQGRGGWSVHSLSCQCLSLRSFCVAVHFHSTTYWNFIYIYIYSFFLSFILFQTMYYIPVVATRSGVLCGTRPRAHFRVQLGRGSSQLQDCCIHVAGMRALPVGCSVNLLSKHKLLHWKPNCFKLGDCTCNVSY